jgi:hypothetical protein
MKEKAVNTNPRNILLLHVHICQKGHHLSRLVMNEVKVTVEEAYIWVPAMCQMV